MNYKIYKCFLLLIIIPCLGISADKKLKINETIIKGTINLDTNYVVYASSLLDKEFIQESTVTQDGHFKIEVDLDKPSWIEITFGRKAKDRQLGASFPLFVIPNSHHEYSLSYSQETYLSVMTSKRHDDNVGLIDYSGFSNRTLRKLFKSRDNEDIHREIVNSYLSETKSIIEKYNIKQKEIIEYLQLWSMNNYLASHKKGTPIPADIQSKIPTVFDTPLTLSFYNGITNVNDFLTSIVDKKNDPLKDIENKIDKLHELFKSEDVIWAITNRFLEQFVSSYRITTLERYEADVVQFENLINKIGAKNLKNTLLKHLKNLHYTTKGSPIPPVEFLDIDGNKVSLKQFEGDYIFIDLWASWCVPCIKEIPFLQKLESDYAEKNITFISLSLDENKNAWKKKVNELNLAGYQWEIGDSNLDNLLNIRGIPHFLLYGPDGKLLMYQAPRPSSEEIRVIFNQF